MVYFGIRNLADMVSLLSARFSLSRILEVKKYGHFQCSLKTKGESEQLFPDFGGHDCSFYFSCANE